MQNTPTQKTFFSRLFETHPSVRELGEIRRAQLQMAFSLLLCILNSVGGVSSLGMGNESSTAMVLLGVGGLCLGAYFLGRTRYYLAGSWLLVTLMALAGYLIFASAQSNLPILTVFIMIPMALVLASALLGLGQQVIFLLANTLAVVLLSLWRPDPLLRPHHAGIIFSFGVLLIAITIFRNRLEREQMDQLRRVNTELESMRENLEEIIQSRTQAAEEAQAKSAAIVQALEEQVWLSNGQVTLASALRDEKNLASLAASAMRALCAHLNSPVAAFFVYQNERLEYLSGYAYLPAEDAPRVFRLGEGLVGQVAMDRQRITINRVGPEHLQVASGLGSGLPQQVILLPCVSNRHLIGVLEIGLKEALPLSHLNFLEQSVETLAVALQASQARQRVAELLAETQAQAEELQAREEELRAANEELLAQAENMRDLDRKKA